MSGIRRVSGVQGLIVLVQSEKHPVYLNSRVEEFLDSVKVRIIFEFIRNKIKDLLYNSKNNIQFSFTSKSICLPKKVQILLEKECKFNSWNFP